MKEQESFSKNIDWIIVGLYLFLVFFGWLNIYAAVLNEDHINLLDLSQNYGKQAVWILAAFIIALFIVIIDAKFFNAFAYPIYIISILTLIAVLFLGKDIAGSKSWFRIGAFAIQPSEFAKFATNLALAKYLSTLDINFKNLKTKVYSFSLFILPALIILLQNDTGSAIVFVSFIFILYRVGLSPYILITGIVLPMLFIITLIFNKYIIISVFTVFAVLAYFSVNRKKIKNIIIIASILIGSAAFIFSVDYSFNHVLEKHQKDRINVLLGKNTDTKGAGYNVNQSKIAIGSGGFAGKGFLQGTQTKYNFVPEQSTDFIFCTIGEEWGFLGSSVIVVIFVIFCMRLIFLAERQRSLFAKLYGYGVASIIFFHFFINVGMTLGVIPVIGIPLPFFSYGGSSLWAFTILLFIFIKLDSNRLKLF